MFGRRSPKNSPRLEAYGTVDELNSTLGVARALGLSELAERVVDSVQERLVGLMGELATAEEDLPEYIRRGYPRISAQDVSWLEQEAAGLEAHDELKFRGWARPGKDAPAGAAQLDLARAVCRRAERCAWAPGAESSNRDLLLFLNRLSDVLWLLARYESVLS